MGLSDNVKSGIGGILSPAWSVTNGTRVPETESIALSNGAVKLDATYLYADMVDSTGLAQTYSKEITAKVIRCYLNAAARIIRARGGEIRSFDGDRVMGIFVGSTKNTSAVTAAFNISWAVNQIIRPELATKWNKFDWVMKHAVGIDTGEALLVRGGVRGDSDLISVGKAPNVAAKLSNIRNSYSTLITPAVYGNMNDQLKHYLSNGSNFWRYLGTQDMGGATVRYYGAEYWRIP